MSEDLKKEMRQLIMLVSSIRSQDQEHWQSHVEYSNQVIEFIKKIQESMDQNWVKINKRLIALNQTLQDSLNSLLVGINPESVKETSKYLKEIQSTMQKSLTSMNLESIMQELGALSGSGIKLTPVRPASSGSRNSAEKISAGSPYASAKSSAAPAADDDPALDGYTAEEQEMIRAYQEIYGPGQIPDHLKKKKKKKDPHLLKPSDFFQG